MSHSPEAALHCVPYDLNIQLEQHTPDAHCAPLARVQFKALQHGSVHSCTDPQSHVSFPSRIPLPQTGFPTDIVGRFFRQDPTLVVVSPVFK